MTVDRVGLVLNKLLGWFVRFTAVILNFIVTLSRSVVKIFQPMSHTAHLYTQFWLEFKMFAGSTDKIPKIPSAA